MSLMIFSAPLLVIKEKERKARPKRLTSLFAGGKVKFAALCWDTVSLLFHVVRKILITFVTIWFVKNVFFKICTTGDTGCFMFVCFEVSIYNHKE